MGAGSLLYYTFPDFSIRFRGEFVYYIYCIRFHACIFFFFGGGGVVLNRDAYAYIGHYFESFRCRDFGVGSESEMVDMCTSYRSLRLIHLIRFL